MTTQRRIYQVDPSRATIGGLTRQGREPEHVTVVWDGVKERQGTAPPLGSFDLARGEQHPGNGRHTTAGRQR